MDALLPLVFLAAQLQPRGDQRTEEEEKEQPVLEGEGKGGGGRGEDEKLGSLAGPPTVVCGKVDNFLAATFPNYSSGERDSLIGLYTTHTVYV